MTSSTRAQIGIGEELTDSLTDVAEFKNALLDCIDHVEKWVEYQVSALADRVAAEPPPLSSRSPMMIERAAFELARGGDIPKAIDVLLQECATASPSPVEYKGWFMQMAGRFMWLSGNQEKAQELQQVAFKMNKRVFPPTAEIAYEPMAAPAADQAQMILESFNDFRRGQDYISKVELKLRNLRGESTSNEFEEALMFLGKVLGFAVERPDNTLHKGPDVLWLMQLGQAFVIEAKSKKIADNPLFKEEKGQLLNACEWFKASYPGWTFTPVIAMPKALVTENSKHGPALCLSFESLAQLRTAVIEALHEIRALPKMSPSRIRETAHILSSRSLTADTLVAYFEEFRTIEDRAGESVKLF